MPQPPTTTPPVQQERAVPPGDAPSPLSTTQRFLAFAASWTVASPVLLLCAAAFYWSLMVRLPASRQLKVHARHTPSAVQTNRPVTTDELVALRKEVEAGSAMLIRDRKDLPPLLTRLDSKARELGWRCETSLRPAVLAPGGVRELTMHPVTIALRYEPVESERAYAGFLAWLWTVSTLPRRAEVTAVRLQSLGHGLKGAEVELHFFSLNINEENPPK